MKYFSIFIIFISFLNSIKSSDGKYPLHIYTSATYKAGIQNIDFAQNRNKTLFVANNLGVLSYNGNNWETHAFKTGKKKRSLAFDEKTNRLYVGAQGDFGFFNANWEFVSLLEQVPLNAQGFDEVWDVFLFNNNVYFCTFQGIYVYDGRAIFVIEYEDGLNKSFQVNGKLFTQSQKGALFEIKDLKLIPTNIQNPNQLIIAGIISQEDAYLIFYNSGEIAFSIPSAITGQYDDLVNALKGRYVNHVLQLSDTRLAIATQTSGLFLYDLKNNSLERITIKDGLPTNACLRTFQDYSGNLWLGMQNGIALIDINSPMRLVNQEIDIQGSGYDVFETKIGTYYTTSNGIYFLDKNARESNFLKGTEGPAYSLQRIRGKLYAGHHTGLFLLENGQAKRLAMTKGLWQVKQLESKPDFAIAGTYEGLFLFKLDENYVLKPLHKLKGFDESSRFFEEDQDGKIWVSQFYKGIYELNLSKTLKTVQVNKIANQHDIPITEQVILSKIDNEFYIATKAGIYQLNYQTKELEKAPLFAEVSNQPVYLLTQDRQNNIHVITENLVGFYKQISPNNYAFVPSSLFQLRYSFNNDLLNVSVNTNNGVWFNANVGFIHYKPELENRIQVEKPLLIKKIKSVTDNSILYNRAPFKAKSGVLKPLTVAYSAKVLQFEVESFQFNEMNNQQFRYCLKGFEEDYGDWTNTAIKEYTNLVEGDYEFLVQTKNYLGEIISSVPLQLRVKPPFYRSFFAKKLYLVLGILALSFILRLQKRRYKKRAKRIEESNKQKLIEIEQKKEQELLQLKEEKMQSELHHLNNLLATSTMNLVIKNEFIETIKGDLKEVKQKGKNIETGRALEKIVKKIDSTLRIQEDWKEFEYHFDQVHGEFLSRIKEEFKDLSPNEQKLCIFLRLNLNTKDVANLMGISIRGVEIARYRLRKKLNLKKGQNMSKFILDY